MIPLHRLREVVMDKNNYDMNIYFYILLGFGALYLYTLLPEKQYIKPYLLSKMELSKQAYAEYLCWRLFLILMSWIAYRYGCSPIFMYLSFGFLIDYLVIYNNPFLYYSKFGFTKEKPSGLFFPFSYSTFVAFVLAWMALWK